MKTKEKRIYFLTIASILIILAVMVVYNFTSFYRSMVSDAELLGENTVLAEVNQIDAYLGIGSNTLKNSVATVEFMLKQNSTPEEIENYLTYQTAEFQKKIDANYTGVYGYIDGQYIDGSGWIPEADYVPVEREWYKAAVEANGEVVLISPYVDAMTNDVIVSVCCLLEDGESVLSIDIVLNKIQEITKNINLNNMGYAFLTDNEGLVVAHYNSEETGKNYKTDNSEMCSILEKMNTSDHFNMTIDGELNYIFTGKTSEDWNVVMLISAYKLLQPVRNILIRNIIIVVLVYVAVILFSVFAFRKLMKSTEEISKKQQQVKKANEELKRSNNAINTIAYNNLITNFKNRYALQEDLESIYKNHKLTIVYYDIDNFSDINEKYGYNTGDSVLNTVSKHIREVTNGKIDVYNMFGDDFCLIFDREKMQISDSGIENIATSVFQRMNNAYQFDNLSVKINTSAAIYHYDKEDILTFDKLISVMQKKIKALKQNGGGASSFNNG